MKTFRLSCKSYTTVTAVGIIGIGTALIIHHWFASHIPVPLSVRSVAGRWEGSALVQEGPLGVRHTVRIPVGITFGPDGRAVTRTGPRMVADTRLDYAVHGEYLVFSNVLDLRENRLSAVRSARHASLTGETLTLRGRGPTVVLHRD